MGELGESINLKARILVSRNAPIALVVGGAGFLGSHLVEKLLKKGIQVIAVDNFITGNKKNLSDAVKEKKFHLINESIESLGRLDLPKLDYAFFTASIPQTSMFHTARERLYFDGLKNFLRIVKDYRSKVAFISSIELYDNKIPHSLEGLKSAEIRFAKFAKEHKLNARILRLAPLYGPRMHFYNDEPIARLVQASLLNELQEEQTSLEFSTRSLFVLDGVDLLIKSVLSGGTAQKIYDGALLSPIKVVDVKQVLLDPLWYEKRGFTPTEIPPWSTPNLKRTMKELSWKPRVGLVEGLKETVLYFKENPVSIPKLPIEKLEREAKMWLEESVIQDTKEDEKGEDYGKAPKSEKRGLVKKFWGRAPIILGLLVIFYALFYPLATIAIGAFSVRTHLENASGQIQLGDFESADREISLAKLSLDNLTALSKGFTILERIPGIESRAFGVGALLGVFEEGVDGASHASNGAKSLFEVTNIVSGESIKDPLPFFDSASLEFGRANQELSDVLAKLNDESFLASLPSFSRERASDFKNKLSFYSGLVEKGRASSNFLPEIIAVNGKKSYLLLFENNFEERGGGGFIYGYAQMDFENGQLKNIKVDSSPKLDSNFSEHIEPPSELKTDIGLTSWKLSDSSYDPDFPTSAKRAEFFYKKEAGTQVNGVIALDLVATQKLLGAVGGADIPEYSEHITPENFYSKVLAHSSDIATSSASLNSKNSNYLIGLQTQLLNRIFFLSKKNWPAIISALSSSLDEKHMQMYLDDPALFSYVLSEDWAGAMPRGVNPKEGQTLDFLASVDSNSGGGFNDFFVQRSYTLKSTIDAGGYIENHLEVRLKDNAKSGDPGDGTYKDRYRLYLPLGAKLISADFDGTDITKKVGSFSDYNRTGYSVFLSLDPGIEKVFSIDYTLPEPLNFSGDTTTYKLTLFKQAGKDRDPFKWEINYPSNIKLTQINGEDATGATQNVAISTDLSSNRSLSFGFRK